MNLLFLAIATFFILSKLFKTLGKNDGYNNTDNPSKIDPIISRLRKNKSPFESPTPQKVDIEIASASEAALPQEMRDIFDRIRKIDHSFNLDKFYHGAKKAFSAILTAFANGDKDTLKHLLHKEVFSKFSEIIAKRKENKQKVENFIVGINNVKVVDVVLDDDKAMITVEIFSDQINSLKDEFGNLLSGHPSKIITLSDSWTFVRDLKRDNIWLLIKTGSIH